MTTYERVRFQPEGGKAQTIYLRDPVECPRGVLGHVLIGIEVDREGDEVAPVGVDERVRIIAAALVSKRTPVVVDRLTALLTEPGETMTEGTS